MRAIMTSVLAAILGVAGAERAAQACGGCFSPPDTDTTVQSHRMVVSLSTERTTLWDQIRYTGSPEDFVWVLPVPSPATEVAVADPLFFDELELRSSPMLSAPPLDWPEDCEEPPPPCPGDEDGYAQDAAAAGGADAGVEVFQEETVGPYEVVVVGSDDAAALQNWLVEHGYNVPASTLPTIEHYTALGNVFVVMRLAPEVGVSAMQPIRIRYPGYMATFPLKMVTVGASGVLGLTLWVVADQRFESRNYSTQTIDQDALVWDFQASDHNYAEVFDDQIDAAGGRAWINEYTGGIDELWLSSAEEVELATVGLSSPTVTRMRTRMLVDHLGEDLELQPAGDPSHVSNFIQVEVGINEPELECYDYPPRDCPATDPLTMWGDRDGGIGCAAAAGGLSARSGALIAVLGVGLALFFRRRRRQ